jgi:MFS family permease
VLLVRHSRVRRHPLLDLRLLDIQTFTVSTFGGCFTRVALNGTPFLLPLMFQLGFGLSPFDAGVLVFFYMIGNLAMKAVTTPLLLRFGFRTVLLVNGVLLSASILAFAAFSPAVPAVAIAVTLLAGGMVRSLQFASLNTLAFADVPNAQRPGATMLSSAMMHLSNSLAVVIAALTLNLTHFIPNVQTNSLASFAVAFLVLAAFGVAALPYFWRLAKDAGAEVTGHSA